MAPLVLQILSILNLATKAAPEVQKLYASARELFTTLFAGGLITAEQQAKLMSWSDAHEAAVLRGELPPEFSVEPDEPV